MYRSVCAYGCRCLWRQKHQVPGAAVILLSHVLWFRGTKIKSSGRHTLSHLTNLLFHILT